VPAPSDPRRAAEVLLAEVHADAVPALGRALRRAAHGDPVAAGMPIGTLMRALPQIGWWTAHDLLTMCGIDPRTRTGDLTAPQRGTLASWLARLQYPMPPVV